VVRSLKLPYRVHLGEDGFYFYNSHRIRYDVKFLIPDVLWEPYPEVNENILDISFYPTKEHKAYDPRISNTIVSIITRAIKKDPSRIITFACDSTDGKEAFRAKLFKQWYEFYNSQNEFYMDTFSSFGSNYDYYTGIIMHNDNPKKELAIKCYKEIMALYLLGDE